jgi:hypothetical protein
MISTIDVKVKGCTFDVTFEMYGGYSIRTFEPLEISILNAVQTDFDTEDEDPLFYDEILNIGDDIYNAVKDKLTAGNRDATMELRQSLSADRYPK